MGISSEKSEAYSCLLRYTQSLKRTPGLLGGVGKQLLQVVLQRTGCQKQAMKSCSLSEPNVFSSKSKGRGFESLAGKNNFEGWSINNFT